MLIGGLSFSSHRKLNSSTNKPSPPPLISLVKDLASPRVSIPVSLQEAWPTP